MAPTGQTNRLLGYPADARLLIVNADDFGMCHAVNQAIFRVLTDGIACSTTLMVPCPWMLHALHFLADNREIPFGIHLKATRYAELLRELPTGLSEWAVHPGLDSPELLAIEPNGNHIRQTDFDFLMSEQARQFIREEGIILLDYRALQAVWKEK